MDFKTRIVKNSSLLYKENPQIEIGQILRQLCEWKGITIIEAEHFSEGQL